MRVMYRKFKATLATWDMLFTEAADFATRIDRDRLISISHSADQAQGVVTVWYWSGGDDNAIAADNDESVSTDELADAVRETEDEDRRP